MIAFTQQEGQWYCFLACLESFLAEQGILVSQEEIRKKTPDIYGAHPTDLGGFAAHSFPRVAEAWGLEVTQIEATNGPTLRNESLFVLCRWDGDASQAHWVRLLRVDTTHVYLMDPGYDTCPRKVAVSQFGPWCVALFLIKKIPSTS